MIKLFCAHCSSFIEVGSFDVEHRERIAQVLSQAPRISHIKLLRELFHVSLAEAKWIMYHISPWGGHCHRCRQRLQERGTVVCNQCGAANLDWLKEVTVPPPHALRVPLNPHYLVDCPQCGYELGHGVTACHRKSCSYKLPNGFYASNKAEDKGE